MKTTILLTLALLGLATAATTVQQFVNDNAVLNYALTLENFEAALYASGAGFTDAQYTAAGFPAGSKATIDYFAVVEAGHATLLTSLLNARGYPAVPACTNYNFNYDTTSVTSFVATLAAVEAVGTSAYDGASLAITSKDILTVAAGIATVEARHTALLNVILNNGTNGGFSPVLAANATTPAYTFAQTIAAVTPFFTTTAGAFITCPAAVLNTTYAGNVTVSSTNFTSYNWSDANTLRNLPAGVFAFYLAVNTTIVNNDLSILQYALALENLEATFYAEFAALYNTTNAAVTNLNATLISLNIGVIAQHEKLHVALLTALLVQGGATPGTACNYDFTGLLPNGNSSTFQQFAAASVTLENTGVSAYVGAISLIANADAASVAATIATVEGEHAAYVANLLNTLGTFAVKGNVSGVAGDSIDTPLTPAAVLANPTVAGILGTCTTAQLGTPAPIKVASTKADFFGDQNQAYNTPFSAAATGTTSTSSTSTSSTRSTSTSSTVTTSTSPVSTTTVTRSGNAVSLVASMTLVAVALAMF